MANRSSTSIWTSGMRLVLSIGIALVIGWLLTVSVRAGTPEHGTPSLLQQHEGPTPTPTTMAGLMVLESNSVATTGAGVPVSNSLRGLQSLVASYYDLSDLQGPVVAAVTYGGPIDFSLACWGESDPWPTCKLHNALADGGDYSVHWQGELLIPSDGVYEFDLRPTDDGARLIIDGTLVADKGWNWPAADTYGPEAGITLTRGTHSLVIDYENRAASVAEFTLRWSGPGSDSNSSTL